MITLEPNPTYYDVAEAVFTKLLEQGAPPALKEWYARHGHGETEQ